MINKLATKYRKLSSALLFALVYIQLVSPLLLHAAQGEYLFKRYVFQPWPVSEHLPAIAAPNESHAGTTTKAATAQHVDKHIGGPGQPEMSSFKSVNANDMVDLFSGDFSYNIPLMDVGGYPVGIHYNSNISMDQEASWVGLGWNINPGTISRSVRGIPDDFNGKDSLRKEQNMLANKTVGVAVGGDVEIFGTPLSIGAKSGVFHK